MINVKDSRVEEEPTVTDLGRGRFIFSDRYSMFDWGEILDHAPNKGASLCLMGTYDFELSDINHVPTHYLGVVEDGRVKELGECESSLTEMAIELAQVPDLSHTDSAYDYDACREAAGDNYLTPLEIVFRNTVPVGSSLRRCGKPADYGLELGERPDEAISPPEPVVEFSMKYEEQDRYLSRAKADDITGRVDLDRLEELALAVDHALTKRTDGAGSDHEDGKVECLYHNNAIRVGDVINTSDENRLSYGGQQVSRKVVRRCYKRIQPEWVETMKDAKAEAIKTGEPNWRGHCVVEPDHLPVDIVETLSDLHCAGTNTYVDHDWSGVPTIEDAVARVRDL